MRWRISAALIEGMAPAPVIVSQAEARHFHPHAAELLARDEKSFMQATEADAEKWAEGLVLAAIEGRRNIVLDGFFKRQEATLNVLRQAREADYDTRVVAIAVPESISRARIVDLYEAGKEKRGCPSSRRWFRYGRARYQSAQKRRSDENVKQPCVPISTRRSGNRNAVITAPTFANAAANPAPSRFFRRRTSPSANG
ncbi:hypothetical protein T281_03805 [Rhodomicrobium udaipurense JA643]|nr:hypothetical protein T281_03805 [Rhodomicrobium udaipurense JA643]